MMISTKKTLSIFFLLFNFFIFFHSSSFAESKLPTVTVINLIRGRELGHEKDDLASSLSDQWIVTNKNKIQATWLFQYTSLEDPKIVEAAKKMRGQDFGLLFEIDKTFSKKSHVFYRGKGPTFLSDGLFLNSYDRDERKRFIDTAFTKFHESFGYYPKVVGAWWIGGDSLTYMQEKYGIVAALRAADQFHLDYYSIWGTPWSTPYIASREHEGIPGKSFEDSSKVVILHWAARDPLRGYTDPLFSMQDKFDYVDYLLGVYLQKSFDNLVVGIENGGTVATFEAYYGVSLKKVRNLVLQKKAQVLFAKDYAQKFLDTKKVFAGRNYFLTKDYSTNDQSFWYISENQRVAIQKVKDRVSLVDLRDYSNKVYEDFDILPNSQNLLRIDTPALFDSIRFPGKILPVIKSSESLRIIEKPNLVTLFSGQKKLAEFTSNELKLFYENDKKTERSFLFNQRTFSISPLQLIILMYYFYFLLLSFLYKNVKKGFKQICLLLIPFLFAHSFLNKDNTFLFDNKELYLLLIPIPIQSIFVIIFFFKIVLFVTLFITHFIAQISKKKIFKVIFYGVLCFTTFLYFHVFYFSLDHGNIKQVILILGIIGVLLLLGVGLLFLKTKSKKILVASIVIVITFMGYVSVATITSRSKYTLTPFEIDALQVIKDQKKDVLYVYQADYGVLPIYREVKPIMYFNRKFMESLTRKKWTTVIRPQSHILNISNYDNKIVVVPGYLGSDLSPYEMNLLKLKKIYDNAQIAIYEKN